MSDATLKLSATEVMDLAEVVEYLRCEEKSCAEHEDSQGHIWLHVVKLREALQRTRLKEATNALRVPNAWMGGRQNDYENSLQPH